jgi:D-glycero-alpha-D-manno-heptose-7-phosphate kinase
MVESGGVSEKLVVQSPTRVDLSGGTIDLWPLHCFAGDCVTVNLSISVFTRATLQKSDNQSVHVDVVDMKFKKTYASVNDFLDSADPQVLLLQKVVGFFKLDQGFQLKTESESPVGGGLGGSSSLCISLLKAFSKLTGQSFSDSELVTIAHNLEAQVLWTPTGTQDYVAAVHPGLNILSYTAKGLAFDRVQLSAQDQQDLGSHLMLVYSGRSHHSGINNWQVFKKSVDKDSDTLTALRKIAEISDRMASAVTSKSWDRLPGLFQEEFVHRLKLSSSFASPEILDIEKISKDAGASAAKICGAGGGGCVLIWARSELQPKIGELCLKKGYQPMKISIVDGSPNP